MNVLFFLTPKANCAYLEDDFTVRQALERMEHSGYAALPILRSDGTYCGTLGEGDLLWAMKNLCDMDIKKAETHSIMDISHRRDNAPVTADTRVEDLFSVAMEQNFVPVVDDRMTFIGIVTRRAILQYCIDRYLVGEKV
ncbi:MAG: CBS domain-containing protein [Oscillospiraceae bacterium]|nr:CBS domain-containing protein [Oscillospiraceae bacterium]MBR2366642.1 CBS domain-containing protein [Oscillospiraceae bacterium]MBR2897518.1 CBS domain-containing protein [Oscillospiraceae bacterium]MBR2978127.1 CBS domain-containing protein [Oscillospiraceae bacterium]MBR3849941.1 CBS domain-containing protein [Oscillospiraceae bacterium]